MTDNFICFKQVFKLNNNRTSVFIIIIIKKNVAIFFFFISSENLLETSENSSLVYVMRLLVSYEILWQEVKHLS